MDIDIFQIPSVLRKRWPVIAATTVIALGLGSAFAVLHKQSFTASADILVDQQGIKSDSGELSIWGASQSQPEAIVDSQIFVLQSRAILADVVRKLDLTKDPAFNNPERNGTGEKAMTSTVTALQRAVSVSRNGQSFILRVSVRHGDADKAAAIANAITEAYLANVSGARSDAITQASSAFQVQAKELRERVFKAEAELERFKAEKGLVSTGQQGLLIDQQVEGINRQLIAARGDLESKKTTYEQASGLTVSAIEAGAIPEAMQSGLLLTLRQKLSDLRSKETELATALGGSHPQMKAIRGQVAAMRTAIQQEITRLRQSMKSAWQRSEANYAAINRELETLKTRSIDSSEAGIGAKQLQSEVDALRALYKTFLTRAEQFGPADASDNTYSRVISPAVAIAGGSLTMKLLVLIAAGLFGIALGSALAVAIEFLTPGGMLRHRAPGAARRPEDETPAALAIAPASRALPVIAEVPLGADAGRFGLKRIGSAVLKPADSQDAQIAFGRAAEALMRGRDHDRPQTVLILSADEDGAARAVLPDIALALNRLDQDVLYSEGDAAPHGQPGEPADTFGGVARLLKFERLTRTRPVEAAASAPTWQRFRDRSRPADFMLVDGTGPAARNHLPGLLHSADAIVIVAHGRTDRRKIERLADALSPWQDAMVGTIMLAEAA